MLEDAGGLALLSRSTPRELAKLAGIGEARATKLAAAFELSRRAVVASTTRTLVGRPEDVYACVAPMLAGLAQEVFLVIGVDIRNGLLDIVECARGSVIGVEIHPREVFRPLVRMAAAGAVLVHNHPSGDPTPSSEDVELTKRLREAGAMLGIPVIDHVVVGDGVFRSIAEWMGAGD
jgi:DNA repair protein RadC